LRDKLELLALIYFYLNATSCGKTVLDLDPQGIAATEIKNLVAEVLQAISDQDF